MIEIFGLKNCDACRKAMKALPEAQLVDVRADGVPDALLAEAYETFGSRLINTRSTTWRGLSETAREGEPLPLLRAHPTLMKRPLIKADGRLFLGWSAEVEDVLKPAG